MAVELSLRPVTMDDAELILEWVNDPLDRANSFSSELITLREHLAWLEASLGDPDKFLYIMVLNGNDVGHVKLDVGGDVAEIGYCVAPNWRGHGLANAAVALIAAEVRDSIPAVKKLIGHVKTSNEASKRAFVKAGYRESSVAYEVDPGDYQLCEVDIARFVHGLDEA